MEFGQYNPKIEKKAIKGMSVGCVNGLAVYGSSFGTVMDIEVTASDVSEGSGNLVVTGIIENEQFDNKGQKLSRKSSARASVENMLTVLSKFYDINYKDYDIHINFPGSVPIDGPSAGIAIVCAVYSAITNTPIDCEIAMTGEISIQGIVKPVGGVIAKVEAAKKAGVKRVLIPHENHQKLFEDFEIEVISVSDISDVFELVFDIKKNVNKRQTSISADANVIAATSI